jgi:uncharacterized protein
MKILAFTDIESNKKQTKIIKDKVKKHNPDVVVFAGDLTFFGLDMEGMVKFLDSLNKTVVLVHGNHDDEIELKVLCSKRKDLKFIHRKVFELNEYMFIGYGGEGFDQRTKDMEDFMLKQDTTCKKVILVIHQPPYGTKLDPMPIYGHIGNKSVNKVIKKLKPLVVFVGHLHENFRKKDYIDSSLIVNPGQTGMIFNV